MYLRHTTRKKDGKVHRYWSLVRSVRVGRRVIQQTVAHLGELDKHGRLAARALSARLIGALASVHAMKGVEIGAAFENARKRGTQVHDEILPEGDRLVRGSNRSGGFEGGITTGEPIVLRVAMKPIATTLTPLRSVDLASGEATRTNYERSDFCPVPRAGVILEAMTAFVLADALIEKLGGDSVSEMKPRFEQLRRARLEDLIMDNMKWKF